MPLSPMPLSPMPLSPVPLSTATMRAIRPAPNIRAFYDGRVANQRLFSADANWVDDGAYELGIASYAIIDGSAALLYDTHISVAHAHVIRRALEAEGVREITVVLSHWHLDHVAGTAIFADCPIIAHAETAARLLAHRARIEHGEHHGMPAILPVYMPTHTYTNTMTLTIGATEVQVRHRDIHSNDATVLVLPAQSLLLAGDTLEDTVTYVSEPDGLSRHLRDLADMATWDIVRILPNHGDPGQIAAGGYDKTLISANQRYIERLLQSRDNPALRALPLASFVRQEIDSDWINFFAPYEAVHQRNLVAVQ
jgi:cyclase